MRLLVAAGLLLWGFGGFAIRLSITVSTAPLFGALGGALDTPLASELLGTGGRLMT